MQLDSENAFVGAEVYCNEELHYVVKINSKSVYLSKDKDFLKKWEERPKGMTWKIFCERNNAFMISYEQVEINKAEAASKDSFIERKKKNKRYLKRQQEKELVKLFEEAKKKFEGKKHKSYKHKTNFDFVIIEVNIEKEMALVRSGTNRFFYDISSDTYIKYNDKKHHKDKKIIWPESLKKNKEEKAVA